tara:strand:+ start:353 stop:634 length:282 start_codon:yes stop_codon:yes gene_type:complete
VGPGIWEILLICVVALVFVKPEELPRIMRKLGRWYASVSRSPRSMWDHLEKQVGPERPQQQPDDPSIAPHPPGAQATHGQAPNAQASRKEDPR